NGKGPQNLRPTPDAVRPIRPLDRMSPPPPTWLPPNPVERRGRPRRQERGSAGDAIPSPIPAQAGAVPWSPQSSRCSQSRMYELAYGDPAVPIRPKHNMRLSETQQRLPRLRLGARGLDAELLHLAVEVRALDPEVPRRVAQVAAVGGEPVEDVLAL